MAYVISMFTKTGDTHGIIMMFAWTYGFAQKNSDVQRLPELHLLL